jgi:hypothetical protein
MTIAKSASFIAIFYLFSVSQMFPFFGASAQEPAVDKVASRSSLAYVDANVPATRLAGKLYDNADSIFKTAKLVHYAHLHLPAEDQVNVKDNIATTDCSGFISYLLQLTAPSHYQVVRAFSSRGFYPKAHTYASFFAQLDPLVSRNGWKQIQFFQDLQRGDLIAWKRGPSAEDHHGHGNSGHVMMVIDTPGAVEQITVDGVPIRYVKIHVLDSSSVRHFEPEQLPPLVNQQHRDGVGKGYIRLVVNDKNMPIGYWEGTFWGEGERHIYKPSYSPAIYFARLMDIPH